MYQRPQHRGKKKNEPRTQYIRIPSRPGGSAQLQYKRVSSGKGGGGTGLPPPSPSPSSAASPSLVYRIVKKSSGEGSQSSLPGASAESVSGKVQSDASISETSGAPTFDAIIKPINKYDQENVEIASKAQFSQSASATSDTGAQKTPVKDNTSKGVSLQFGSFSPDYVDGTQAPARTNSAPPNLNEQKRNKAWHGSSKGDHFSTTAARQPQPWEVNVQTKDPDPKPRPRKDLHTQISAAPFLCTMQNSSFIPLPEVSVTMPYQQPHVPMQGGFPGPQLQHPGMPFSSYQIPMQLPGGDNSQIWQPPFIPGMQPCSLPPQGLMHQGPVLNYPPRHDYKPHSQFGGVGVGVSPQHAGRPTACKPVKITHPETHEELILHEKVDAKLDGGTARVPSYHNRDSQPQTFYYGPSHARNSFSHMQPNPFKQSPTSALLKNSQMPPDLPTLEQKSSGMCNIAVSSNRELIPSHVAVTSPSLLADRSNGDILAPVSANSSDVKTPMRAMHPSSKKAESQIHSKFSTKQPTFVPRSSVQLSMIPSHDATFIEKNIGARRERTVQGLDSHTNQLKSIKTVPMLHSAQSHVGSQTLADGSAVIPREEPEHARAAVSSANDLQVGHGTVNEASECNVVINTNNKALKMAKRDDDGPLDIPAERFKASSKQLKANGVEQYSLDYNGNGEDIHGSREINALASGSPQSIWKPLNGSEVQLSDSESKQPMSAPSCLNSSSSTSLFKVKGKSFEEVNCDHSSVSNLNRAKSAFSRRREKRKEILKKADAAGATADLYMPCKDPRKKLESSDSSVSLQSSSCFSVMQASSGSFEEDATATTNQDYRNITETDDWKNDAEISTQKLETSSKPELVVHHKAKHLFDGKKRYSIDFLITLSSNFTNLPTDFRLASDLAESLLCSNAITAKLVKHSPKGASPNNAQLVSRTAGISRLEYRAISVTDNVRRAKPQAIFASGPEPCNGANRSANNYGIRPGHRGNYDVGRNLRVHAPMQRNSRNGNKWQRASRSVKGLIPSPQSPLHRAEKKYEVRKVNDVEEGKQRQLKAILNKLTPQNFERLFQQVKEVTIDNAATLAGVISQIFDKALMEPTFCEMYVDLCYHLASELPDFVEDDQRITFKRLLLNKCQEEFERGEREQAEAEKMEGDGEFRQSAQEREEKRIQARRRMLGNIRLIGELYKNKMLTERIMHECIQKLLGDDQNPDEEDIEALCKLMCTIGEMIDHAKSKDQMDTYFEILSNLANNTGLSSRLRFMLMDVIDLRKNNWQQRRKVEGPKKLEELHRDAHQERQAQTSRFTRAPNIPSPRRGHPPDIDNHASTMLSTSQINAVHGMPSHIHGFGGQDVRLEDKNFHESQASSFSQPRTSINDNTIYLGPWGMSASGPLMLSCSPPTDINSGFGETIRIRGGPGGYSPVSDLLPYNVRQEPISRYSLESFVRPSVYDHTIQHGNVLYASRDAANLNCSFGRSSELSSSACLQAHPFAPNPLTEKALPEERLAELSISAIREFYSAVDENEVVLCIRELNSPNFLPTLISLWVNDSFERKDRDRILLSRLLVNLTKSRGIMNSGQLISGFESVLATLEDAITDAPKAAAFLGSMFGTMIIENVVSLEKIGNLIRESSKKPGHLQIGLAHEVLENTFQMIKSEKGESFLREICMNSNIELEDFAPRNLTNELVSQPG